MGPGRLLALLSLTALAAFAGTACDGSKTKAGAADLDQRCVQLANTCGEADKHRAKIAEECKWAAQQQVEKSCGAKAIAAYDCFERELCGKADKVWALDDLGVLAERHGKCVAERDAALACVGQ
jgi:hypothetical protein